MSDPAKGNIIEFTAFNAEARENPHGKLKQLRESTSAMRDDAAKVWMVSRFKDVRGLINDPAMLRSPHAAEEGSISRRFAQMNDGDGPQSILFMDDPDHARVRKPLAKALYKRIQSMKTEIEGLIDTVIDACPADGIFDLMKDVAIPVPVLVIAHILGVDESRLDDFREWSEAAILSLNPVRTPDQTAQMEAGNEALLQYFSELLERRRRNPREDLISDMASYQASGGEMSDAELLTNLASLLIGGNLTTTDLIGNGVWLLLTHPDELRKLRADRSLTGPAVDEILRFESPVASTSRTLPADHEVAGCPMKQSQTVFCSLHGANRDPEVFAQSDRFDITRAKKAHVAFGGGQHLCIGAPLARIEARRVLEKLLDRYDTIELAQDEIVWRQLPFFRGIEELKIRVS